MLSTLSFFVLITDGNGGNTLRHVIFYLGTGFFWCSSPRSSPRFRCMPAGRICGRAWAVLSTMFADTRDGSGGGDYLESKRAGGSGDVARAVCRHRDFAVRASLDKTVRRGDARRLALATDDLGVSCEPGQADTVALEAPELSLDDRLDGRCRLGAHQARARCSRHRSFRRQHADAAAALFPRSTLYRQHARINKKVGTARVALISLWSWTPQD